MKFLAIVTLLAFPLLRAADGLPAIQATEIPSPALSAAATGPSLTVSPDGIVWLTWLERSGATTALRFSTLDPTKKTWRAAQTIASGSDWFINGADFPALTAGPDGRATAVWFVNNPGPTANAKSHDHHGPGYRAVLSRTTDGGKTWSAAAPLTRESAAVEFASLTTLADGRVLAAWLDGRAKKTGGKAQQLYARIVGAQEPDVLIDPSVCECCQTTLTAFPDGTALLAYRGRSDQDVRDIRVTRFRGGRWDETRGLNNDDWRITGCPVNGPQLASDGGRVAAAWFTAADNDPRVLASYSTDAGARFLLPLRISEKKPLGRVATTLLHDGALLVTFVDAEGAVWLRRVTPDFAAAESVELHGAPNARVKGFPRTALWHNYDGGKAPAEVVVAFAPENAGVRTLLVTVPEGELLEAEKNCDCAPTADQLRGFPIRGTILSRDDTSGALQVKHYEVPGIFAAATRDFKLAPGVPARGLEPGREFLGRIEQRAGEWWLFDLRLIATAPR